MPPARPAIPSCCVFFGDDLRYRPFPDAKPDYFMDLRAFDVGSLKAGDLYRSEHFLQLR